MSAIDKLRNGAQGLQGRSAEATGDATDNEAPQNEGRAAQAAADAKKAGENFKDTFKH